MGINKSAGPCPLCKADLENYTYDFVNKDGKVEKHNGVRCTKCNFSTKG